ERKEVDYPLPYVRWTEQRNLQEFLHLVAAGKVRLAPLITHRFSIDEAERVYDLIQQGKEKYIAVLLTYPETQASLAPRVELRVPAVRAPADAVRLGVIGAGLFANTTLLPVLKGMPGVVLRGIATASGFTGQHAGCKFGFEYCTTDYRQILEDPEIDGVLILTRHNLHARMVVDALHAGKHVFVEKPLALSTDELRQVVTAYEPNPRILMVGFNRRFSPFTRRARELMSRTGPLFIHCRVNAGPVPRDSWVVDADEGGGRILGEVCHFVDLAGYLAGANPVLVYTAGLRDGSGKVSADDVSVTLNLADGSVAQIGYVARGDKAFSRERVEIFGGGSVCVIDDFRRLVYVGGGRRRSMAALNVDRGHKAEMEEFISAVAGRREPPVPFEDYVATTMATIAAQDSLFRGIPVHIELAELLAASGGHQGQ
ncbi:MAG: Gfo/Idh/MocA family oxidoreductase, partial [Bacillota bacterium]